MTQRAPNTYNVFNAIDKRVHRVKRRIIGQGILQASMHKFEPMMMGHINVFVKQLLKSEGPINVTDYCKRLGVDIISHLGFGASLNLQTDPRNRWMIPRMTNVNFRAGYNMQLPALYYLPPLPHTCRCDSNDIHFFCL